jgi:hypothetical protein
MTLDEERTDIVSRHRRALGVFWIVYGIFRLIMGVGLILFSGTATVMFGALLARVPDPFTLMSEFHIVYLAVVALSFVCGVLGVVSGLALMGNQRQARVLALVAAFFSVSNIPLGTTLGIYTLVVLLGSRPAPSSVT